MKFHHLGIVCKDIKKSLVELEKIYDVDTISNIVYDSNQDAEVCLIETSNGINIELISGNRVSGLLKKGITYYHCCYLTTDIETEIIRLKKEGALVVIPPRKAPLFNYKNVSFLFTPHGLIELLEE